MNAVGYHMLTDGW